MLYQPDGLPNIEGSAYSMGIGKEKVTSLFTGAFSKSIEGSSLVQGGPDNAAGKFNGTLILNAHESNNIYGNSNFVQPKNVSLMPILKY